MYIPQNIIDILSNKDCEEVAVKLGINVSRHRALCFMHAESVPSLSFNPKRKNMWKCFSCNKGGNAISLVMEHQKLDFVAACQWLCGVYGISLGNARGQRPYRRTKTVVITPTLNDSQKDIEEKEFDKEMGEWLIKNLGLGDMASLFLLTRRGIKKEVVEGLRIRSIENPWMVKNQLLSRFGAARCAKSGLFKETGNLCFWTPCLVFPYYNPEGELIGLQTRYLGDSPNAPRFQFLSKEKTHLFNMQCLTQLRLGETLYISEGVTDCLAMLSNGLKVVAIPSATIIPQGDLYQLRKYRVVMIPDNDEAGWKGFQKLNSIMAEKGIALWKETLPEGFKDYGEYYQNMQTKE